jgi:signal transduction histidine kinase
VRGADVRMIIERLRQILECQVICLVLACPDPDLRHPLFAFWPGSLSPVVCSGAFPSERLRQADLWMEESIQALSDLAIQSRRMRVRDVRTSRAGQWGLQSLAAFPLERPAGVLGTLLLADEQPERFGEGEEHLLSASLSLYAERLESALWEEVRASLAAGSGQVDGGEGAARDQRIPGEFISMVVHELRAPLSVIKGYAGLLQAYGGSDDPALTPDRQCHYLDVIMEQTGLLEILVNDLLDLSRLQRGKLALRPRSVDVGALCRQVVQLGQLRADQLAAGKYRLECRLPDSLPPIWADAERLRQVLMNVIENAIKYSPEGGHIELEIRLQGDRGEWAHRTGGVRTSEQVCISIRDQGVGISEQHLAHLFHPFERLERPAISHIQGTGLGLSITRRLVEAMGGSIDVRSREGSGTDVMILLPLSGAGEMGASAMTVQMSTLSAG